MVYGSAIYYHVESKQTANKIVLTLSNEEMN